MRRLYATSSMPRSAPRLRSSSGASTHRSAGMRKSRCGVAGSSSVCQSRSVGVRASAGIGGTCHPRAMSVADLPTPALVVDAGALAHNLDTMTHALPGDRLRPHVKAHKCTALAQEQAVRGHRGFTCATPREVIGMARGASSATTCCSRTRRSTPHAHRGRWPTPARACTVAVDSAETIDAAADERDPRGARRRQRRHAALRLPSRRTRAGSPTWPARAASTVRGVMGYEGHVVGLADRAERVAQDRATRWRSSPPRTRPSAATSSRPAAPARSTSTRSRPRSRPARTRLMDTAYGELQLPFRTALRVVATVVHVSPKYAVADCGLKALGMDHGNPTIEGGEVWFCSDEHVTFAMDPRAARRRPRARAARPRRPDRRVPRRRSTSPTDPTSTPA